MASVVIVGSTGSVGRRCVYFAVLDPRISRVTAVMRSPPKPADFFGLMPVHQGLFESKLHQVQVDFNNLEASKALEGHSAGISCLGIYSSEAKGWKDFMEREHNLNLRVANLVAGGGGQAVGIPERFGREAAARFSIAPLFRAAHVLVCEGCTERDLGAIHKFVDEGGVTVVRPAMILGRSTPYPGATRYVEAFFNTKWGSWISRTSAAVHQDEIAKALVHSVVARLPGNEILENQEIKLRAKDYPEVKA
jgi:hypothetical protein